MPMPTCRMPPPTPDILRSSPTMIRLAMLRLSPMAPTGLSLRPVLPSPTPPNREDARMSKIDLDRGVLIRKHETTGTTIYMYFDTPGVYLNAHGGKVSEALAKQAGFDVDLYGKK